MWTRFIVIALAVVLSLVKAVILARTDAPSSPNQDSLVETPLPKPGLALSLERR